MKKEMLFMVLVILCFGTFQLFSGRFTTRSRAFQPEHITRISARRLQTVMQEVASLKEQLSKSEAARLSLQVQLAALANGNTPFGQPAQAAVHKTDAEADQRKPAALPVALGGGRFANLTQDSPPISDEMIPFSAGMAGMAGARAFPKWTKPFPCTKRNTIHPSGILYVKILKSASSTSGGIARRLAARNGQRCSVEAEHGRAFDRGYHRRDKEKSLLWTILRHPDSRAMSQVFYFKVSGRDMEPTDENILNQLRKMDSVDGHGGYGLHYVATQELSAGTFWTPEQPTKVKNVAGLVNTVEKVLADYDFIGLAERIDESFVVLRLLLGLDAGDVIYLASKVSGNNDCRNNKPTKPFFKSDGVAAFLASEEWQARNAGDLMLYSAVNRSLEASIEAIGRARFEEAMKEHRALQARAAEVCAAPPPRTPCGKSSLVCYWRDNGCGYPCLDKLAPKVKTGG